MSHEGSLKARCSNNLGQLGALTPTKSPRVSVFMFYNHFNSVA